MTLFEYLSVATSIVLSLSAAQLLTRLRSILDPTTRHWIHALWVALLLFGHLVVWWEFWGYRDVATWNFVSFAILLLNPGILFVASSVLVHSDKEPESQGWQEHFFNVHRSFFASFGLLPVVSIVRRWFLTDLPILSTNNLPEVGFGFLCFVGFVSSKRTVHAALVVVYWLALLFTTTNYWFFPGDIANLSAPGG